VTHRQRTWPCAACLAAALFLPARADAYRPFDSTDAAVANPLELELEVGPLDYLVLGSSSFFVIPNLVVNLGFAPGWEVVLQGEQLVRVGSTGGAPRISLENTALLVKGVLRDGCLQDAPGPSIALETGVLLPTVNAQQGFGGSLTLILSQRWGAVTASFDASVFVTHTGSVGGEGGVIVEGPFSWTIRPVSEVVVAHGVVTAGTAYSLLVGAIWRLGEELTLDAAVRGGRDSGRTVGEFRAGFTWSIAL